MSKLTWKIQEKFVERILKGETLWYDFMPNMDEVAFGDNFHYFVMNTEDVFVDFHKLESKGDFFMFRKMRVLPEFHKCDFCANVSLTFEQRAKDKGVLRKFEYLDKHIWINEAYLKEFDFLKDPEAFCIGADPVDGFKKPVMFESEELTVVILPVRVGDENGHKDVDL